MSVMAVQLVVNRLLQTCLLSK